MGTVPIMRPLEKKTVPIFNVALAGAILLCLMMIGYFSINRFTHAYMPLIIGASLFVACFIIHSNGKILFSKLLAVITSTFLTFYMSSITRGSAHFQLFYITIFLFIFVLYDSEKTFFPYSLLMPVFAFSIGEFFHHQFFTAVSTDFLSTLKGFSLTTNIVLINFVFFIHVRTTNSFEKEREHYLELLNNNIKNQMHQHKLASLGEMAGSISHEVNNPLTIILGKASILKMHIEQEHYDVDNYLKLLTSIEDASIRISHIIRTLNTYAKSTENEEFTDHYLIETINDCELLLKKKMRAQFVQFENQVPQDLKINCRKSQLMQAIYSLMKISLQRLKNEKLMNPRIKISTEIEASEIKILIQDNGHELFEVQAMNFLSSSEILDNQIGYSVSTQIIDDMKGRVEMTQYPLNSFIIHLPSNNSKT